ncbi:MAG: S8 family serine peptidase [Paracoccaceae bacterium]|nr:S8 family serine peptidase [Paracoccaceae bacterium]
MSALRNLIRGSLCALLLAGLAGCGGGSDAGAAAGTGSTTSSGTAQTGTPGATQTGGSLAFPWDQYYVTAFDMAKVLALRTVSTFKNATLTLTLTVPGSPVFANGANETSNALIDAHLDYAFSTGLTGKGVTLGLIDDGVNTAHVQFAGKTIAQDGSTGAVDFHGTAVASVMLGNGQDGQMTGFAPGADLFTGYLNYANPINWSQLATYMNDAASRKVLAVNNSWGLAGSTVANTNFTTLFAAPDAQSYLTALQTYAKTGVIVFAVQNDYSATSVDAMAGLPSAYPALKGSWIAVINAIPKISFTSGGDSTITGATRISAPCAEAATYCLAANGQVLVADSKTATGYTAGSGASFAAPQVTGALGLLAQAFPTLTAPQLRDRLLATAYNGFFTPTGSVTFAPGVVHGYNSEFGMGFLDLKAALLPIGQTSVPTASGQQIAVGQAAIVTSAASGNAVAKALAPAHVIALDSMAGSFTLPATTIVGAPAVTDLSTLRLGVITSPDATAEAAAYNGAIARGTAEAMLNHIDLMANPDAAVLYGGNLRDVLDQNGFHLSILRDRTDTLTGLSVSHDWPLGQAALRLGFIRFDEGGSALGVGAPGYTDGTTSHVQAVKIGLAAPLAPGTSLRAVAEFGEASGVSGGMISGMSALAYNRMGVALDRTNVFRPGDVLTLFARTPVAITAGSATMALPVSYSASGPGFSDAAIPLSPAAREVDAGFEYARPLWASAILRGGLAVQANAGNVAGKTGLAGVIGVAMRF